LVNKGVNWGADVEDFPSGLFDDFDGTYVLFEYEEGDYGTQIHTMVLPKDYEYSARHMEMPEDPNSDDARLPQGWYGLGGDVDTYEISEDGRSLLSGPQPGRNTRGTKLILAVREHMGARLKGSDISMIESLEGHFKSVTETGRNPTTSEITSRDILYPSGKVVGSSIYGKKDKKSDGSGSSRTSRSRRSVNEDTTDDASDDNTTDNSLINAAIVSVVTEAGDDGLARNKVAQALAGAEEELGAEVVASAAKRSAIASAISDGVVVNEDGVLFLPE
jgi:hypothetical protein